MRTFRTVIVVAALALLVSACSSLIPDQTLTNPLGLNNKSVALDTVTTAGLAPQAGATSTTFSGSTSSTFQDVSGIPSWVSASGFQSDLTATSVTINSTAPSTLPASLDVTEFKFDVTAKDGSGSPSLTFNYDSGQKTQLLKLTQTSCDSTSCTYSVAAGSDLSGTVDQLVQISLSSGDAQKLLDMVRGGDATNDVSASVALTVGTALSTTTTTSMDITLKNATATLKFG